jgi:CHAT domain-containing protein
MPMTVASISELLDEPPVHSGDSPGRPSQEPTASPTATPPPRPLRLSVTWGDITLVPADIHVAGHYQGVIPTSAERALDGKISTLRRVIEEHTRRGWLVGALGEIAYFPSSDAAKSDGAVRRVAVMGMGRPGTFSELRATQMYASMLSELIGLDTVKRVAAVLIGSGAGNLTVEQASRALVTGFASAADRPTFPGSLEEVTLVEIDRLRAEKLRLALDQISREVPSLVVSPSILRGEEGVVWLESAAVFAICELGRLVRAHDRKLDERGKRAAGRDPISTLLDGVPPELKAAVRQQLGKISDDHTSVAFVLGDSQQAAGDAPPVRISVVRDREGFRWAALTERSTIPERLHDLNPALVKQIEDRLTAPSRDDAADLPSFLTRFVVPVDFQPHVSAQTKLVLEVDRDTARIPWEFLTDDAYESLERPLAVRTSISRQLRTSYASVVGEDAEGKELRALVIGDPGDAEHALPQARDEALAVADQLRACGFEVRLFLGAERAGATDASGAEAATQLDILKELLGRRYYHVVHYSGHATFDPDDARRRGWLFADGLLGARELTQLTRAPRLVFANACWTAARTDGEEHDPAAQAMLTPILADEFLRVGVVHYIGTSWRVPDDLARRFAQTFYESLLGTRERQNVGESLRRGREVLYLARSPEGTDEEWSAWAAYQHYGDPNDTLQPAAPEGEAGEERR